MVKGKRDYLKISWRAWNLNGNNKRVVERKGITVNNDLGIEYCIKKLKLIVEWSIIKSIRIR